MVITKAVTTVGQTVDWQGNPFILLNLDGGMHLYVPVPVVPAQEGRPKPGDLVTISIQKK